MRLLQIAFLWSPLAGPWQKHLRSRLLSLWGGRDLRLPMSASSRAEAVPSASISTSSPRFRQSGERVVIDGPCLSACTLVLSSVPRKRICVTSRAVLGFHAPYLVDDKGRKFRSREITQAVNAAYPANVRSWIKRNGGLNGKTILLKGRELNALVPRC
jgi:hypothetical protein